MDGGHYLMLTNYLWSWFPNFWVQFLQMQLSYMKLHCMCVSLGFEQCNSYIFPNPKSIHFTVADDNVMTVLFSDSELFKKLS